MKTLRRLERLADSIEAAEASRGSLIAQARAEGATWEQIAKALRMSRAGVINLHNAEIAKEQGA